MTALSIQPPFPLLTDIDGQPLEDGYIWIGVANLPPIGNPIAVYWDAALTQPAALPVRTRGGYPVNAGTPARLYVNSDYSIQVQNKNGSVLYSAPQATERYGALIISSADVSFLQAGSGAVVRTAQSKMRDVVSVKDFGAVGDGVADDTAAIQAASTAAATQYKSLYFPSGVYLVTALSVPSYAHWIGEGCDNTTIKTTSLAAQVILSINGKTEVELEGFRFYGIKNTTANYGGGIQVYNSNRVYIHDCTFENFSWHGVVVQGTQGSGSLYVQIERCEFRLWDTPQFDSGCVTIREYSQSCTVRDCLMTANTYHGVVCQPYPPAQLNGNIRGHIIVNNTIKTKQAYGITLYDYNADYAISSVANNGVGLIRVTTSNAHGFSTGDEVLINNVGGTTEANGIWTIAVINSTSFDLSGSNYVNAYTSGGTAMITNDVWDLVDGNTISDIDGAVVGGDSGAGIYAVGVGNVRIVNNHISNSNINTSSESLSPAGIGVSGLRGSCVISGNLVERCKWHGILASSCVYGGTVTITANTVRDCTRVAIRSDGSKNVTITGNSIVTGRSATSIGIRHNAPSAYEGIVISGNHVLAYTSRSIQLQFARDFAVTGNTLVNGRASGAIEGLLVEDCNQGSVVGNTVDMGASVGCPVLITRVTNTRISANSFKGGQPAGQVAFTALLTGTCTNTLFDETNSLSDMYAYNNSTGGTMHTRGTSAPTNAARQVGDIHWNTAPISGGTIGWVTTTAGDPPTWKTWGNIA
jgi:hypothetical protein